MTQLSPFFCPYTSDYNTGFELKDCFQPLFMYYVGIHCKYFQASCRHEQAVSTRIVGKTFVTGVPRFCQLILDVKYLFQVEGLQFVQVRLTQIKGLTFTALAPSKPALDYKLVVNTDRT